MSLQISPNKIIEQEAESLGYRLEEELPITRDDFITIKDLRNCETRLNGKPAIRHKNDAHACFIFKHELELNNKEIIKFMKLPGQSSDLNIDTDDWIIILQVIYYYYIEIEFISN